ncbi:uncharacterized protein BJ171DRAFT_253861 [Polychytrium aggregatum]|uniref:uncharacterized protein n=1 Tax=Polychytrium aggregatum TaxID=110093 RepID=UPI0022FDCDB9|nr:uncharacterized protein BJ171DRAFT_253861 [Polychytrium aggregatum]KAI9193522.1 hypothetical protein BJ171DRAFT_253861 [Polychytrium aggregatum]
MSLDPRDGRSKMIEPPGGSGDRFGQQVQASHASCRPEAIPASETSPPASPVFSISRSQVRQQLHQIGCDNALQLDDSVLDEFIQELRVAYEAEMKWVDRELESFREMNLASESWHASHSQSGDDLYDAGLDMSCPQTNDTACNIQQPQGRFVESGRPPGSSPIETNFAACQTDSFHTKSGLPQPQQPTWIKTRAGHQIPDFDLDEVNSAPLPQTPPPPAGGTTLYGSNDGIPRSDLRDPASSGDTMARHQLYPMESLQRPLAPADYGRKFPLPSRGVPSQAIECGSQQHDAYPQVRRRTPNPLLSLETEQGSERPSSTAYVDFSAPTSRATAPVTHHLSTSASVGQHEPISSVNYQLPSPKMDAPIESFSRSFSSSTSSESMRLLKEIEMDMLARESEYRVRLTDLDLRPIHRRIRQQQERRRAASHTQQLIEPLEGDVESYSPPRYSPFERSNRRSDGAKWISSSTISPKRYSTSFEPLETAPLETEPSRTPKSHQAARQISRGPKARNGDDVAHAREQRSQLLYDKSHQYPAFESTTRTKTSGQRVQLWTSHDDIGQELGLGAESYSSSAPVSPTSSSASSSHHGKTSKKLTRRTRCMCANDSAVARSPIKLLMPP